MACGCVVVLQEERHTTEMGSVPESPLIPTLDLLAYTLLLKVLTHDHHPLVLTGDP